MPRLPDIPSAAWAADQIDLFKRQTEGYFPALEFEAVTNDQNTQIPADWPYPGGKDQWQQAADQAAEEERQRQQRLLEQQQQTADQAEQQRHAALQEQAIQMASSLGIPTPSDVFSHFQQAESQPPGTGDNTSTAGVFEPGTQPLGYQPPASAPRPDPLEPDVAPSSIPRDVGPYPPYGGVAGRIDRTPNIVPYDETTGDTTEPTGTFKPMQSVEDFNAYANGQQQQYGLQPSEAADARGSALGNAASALWNSIPSPADIPDRLADVGRSAGQSVVEEARALPGQLRDIGESAGRNTGQVVRGIGQLALGDNAFTELQAGGQGIGKYVLSPLEAGAEAVPGAVQHEIARETKTPENYTERTQQMLETGIPNARAVKAYGNIAGEITGAMGDRFSDELGVSNKPIATVPIIGDISARDLIRVGAQNLLDPTNWIGAGAAEHALSESRRGLSLAERLALKGPEVGRELVDAAGNIVDDPLRAARLPSAAWDIAKEVGRDFAHPEITGPVVRAIGSAAREATDRVGEGARALAGSDAVRQVDALAGRGIDYGLSAGRYALGGVREGLNKGLDVMQGVVPGETRLSREAPRPEPSGFFPPEQREALAGKTPVQIPLDKDFRDAVVNAGGDITDRGVEAYAVRASTPNLGGKTAVRGGLFYELTNRRGRSNYIQEDSVHGIGGTLELPATRTLFRKPLITHGTPGDEGFTEAIQKLADENPNLPIAQVPRTEASRMYDILDDQGFVDSVTKDDLFSMLNGSTNNHNLEIQSTEPYNHLQQDPKKLHVYDPADGKLLGIWEDADAAEAALGTDKYQSAVGIWESKPEVPGAVTYAPLTLEQLNQEIGQIKKNTRRNTPERKAGLVGLLTKYGGDPSVVDDLLAIRGDMSGESMYAIRENILSANARKQNVDGIFSVETGYGTADYEAEAAELLKNPEYAAAMQDLADRSEQINNLVKEMHEYQVDLRRLHGEMTGLDPVNDANALRQYNDERARIAALVRAKQDQVETLSDAQDVVKMKLVDIETALKNSPDWPIPSDSSITEVFDPEHGRNPMPGVEHPVVAESRQKIADAKAAHRDAIAERDQLLLDYRDKYPDARGDGTPEWENAHQAIIDANEKVRLASNAADRASYAHKDLTGPYNEQDLRPSPPETYPHPETLARGEAAGTYPPAPAEAPLPYPRSSRFTGEPGQEIETTVRDRIARGGVQDIARQGGTIGGGLSGGVAGSTAGDEDTDWQTRLRNTALGIGIGAIAGRSLAPKAASAGMIGAGKFLDSLIRRGKLDPAMLSTHPDVEQRILALMSAAVEGIPDDTPISPSSLADYLIKQNRLKLPPEYMTFLGDEGRTVADYKTFIGEHAAPDANLRQKLGEMVSDAITGLPLRASRREEAAADLATAEPVARFQERAARAAGDTRSRLPDYANPLDAEHLLPFKPEYRFASGVKDWKGVLDDAAKAVGLETPEIRLIPSDTPNAQVFTDPTHKPVLGISRGLLQSDITEDELGSLFLHELSHVADDMANPGSVKTLGIVPGSHADIWQQRMERGLEVPEKATPAERERLTSTFNRAAEQFAKIQTAKRPTLKLRWESDGERYWKIYEDNRDKIFARREPTSRLRLSTPEERAARRAPEPPPESAPTPEPVPAVREETGTGVGGETPTAETPSPTEATVAGPEDIPFEEEPLPTTLDPARVFTNDEAGKVISSLRDKLAMDEPTKNWMLAQAVNLLGLKKITGSNVQRLLTAVGERRAPPRGDPAEYAQRFADDILRDNGIIAKSDLGPTGGMSPLGVASNLTQMGVTGGMGAAYEQQAGDPNDPNRALKGFVAGALAPFSIQALTRGGLRAAGKEIPAAEGALSNIGGLFGPRRDNKLAQHLLNNTDLTANPQVQMFVSPTTNSQLTNLTASEHAYNFWRNKVASGVTDRMAALQGWQNDLAKIFKKQTGMQIPPEVMAAENARLNSNRAVEMDIMEHYQPHLQKFHELGIPNQYVDNYLLNLQNIDIAKWQSKRTAAPPGSGVFLEVPNLTRKFPGFQTYEGAILWNKKFESELRGVNNLELPHLTPDQYKEFQAAIKGVHDFGDRVLQYSLAGDLITEDTYNQLRAAYPHYVPTHIIDYLLDDARLGQGKSLSVNSNTLRELTTQGTTKEAISPMAALAGQAFLVHEAAQKNIVANKFVNLWEMSSGHTPYPDFMPPSTAAGNLTAEERRVARYAQGMQPVMPNEAVPKDKQALTLFRNGEKRKYALDKELGDIVMFSGTPAIPIFSGLSAAFRAGATSRNPAFLAANTLLDFSSVLVRETIREAENQKFGAIGALPRVLYEYGKAMGEFNNWLSPQFWKDVSTNTYRGDMAEVLRQGGGMSGGHYAGSGRRPPEWGTMRMVGQNIDLGHLQDWLGAGQHSQLESEVRKLQRGVLEVNSKAELFHRVKDVALFKPVEKIGERGELAARLPGYRLAQRRAQKVIQPLQDELALSESIVKQGRTPGIGPDESIRTPEELRQLIAQEQERGTLQSVQNFRTTTLDFDKGGSWAKTINQFIPFFNVGVQSATDVFRAYQENPSAWMATVAGTVVLPTIAAEMWNQADPQRARDYADVPQYIKDRGVVVMLPETIGGVPAWPATVDAKGNRYPQSFLFPFRQLAPLSMATRAVLQNTVYKGSEGSQDERSPLELGGAALAQELPINPGSPQDLAIAPVPPVLSTGMQLAFDRDTFRGNRRIRSKYADERASPLSHAISGATQAIAGDWGMTPAQAEFTTRDIGSGYANVFHGASEMFGGRPARAEAPAGISRYVNQDTPVVGGLYNRFVRGSIGEGAQEAETSTITGSASNLLRQNGIGWRPSPVDPEVAGIPLTRVEYGVLQKNINRVVDETIQETARDPRWRAMEPTDKEDVLKTYVARVRAAEEARFLGSISKDERKRRAAGGVR